MSSARRKCLRQPESERAAFCVILNNDVVVLCPANN
jgi:hypothetical protein